jgi:hypothetical protein
MAGSEFYLTLPSTTGDYPTNKIGEYRVRLPHEISLEGEWSCTLFELLYPKTYMTFTNAMIGIVTTESARRNKIEMLDVPNSHYATTGELLGAIKNALTKLCDDKKNDAAMMEDTSALLEAQRRYELMKDSVKLSYDSESRRVRISISGETSHMYMNDKMAYILGFKDTTGLPRGSHIASSIPDPQGGLSTCFVYCNIIQPQIVGNTVAPLLKVIPLGGVFGEQISVSFPHLQYAKVLVKRFSTIEISIKGNSGDVLPFAFGTVHATLHFRRLSIT